MRVWKVQSRLRLGNVCVGMVYVEDICCFGDDDVCVDSGNATGV